MVTDDHVKKFIKRWTITVVYIAVVLTGILGLRLYEVFFQ